VNNLYKQLPSNPKLKIEWGRLIAMIICFEITYGRYLNDTGEMFKEADENHEVFIPREKTQVNNLIEIEDETNEIQSERKDETDTIDINDKLQLSKIEKENAILINDDDRNAYKEKYNINFNEENIFILLQDLHRELRR
jgi:hypothetical protein